MEEFVIRAALDGSGRPLIEFRGDHRAEKFPPVLALLQRELPEFSASGENPGLDDFVWHCTFLGGSFVISNDWAGLFVIPSEQSEQIVEAVAGALERSGSFRRVAERSA